MMRLSLSLSLLLSAIGVVTDQPVASAAPGDCIAASGEQNWDYPLNGQRRYRINSSSFGFLNPPNPPPQPVEGAISPDEGITAVVMGADRWNEQANALHFVFDGTTERLDLPEWDEDWQGPGTGCASQGITYSLVVVRNTTSNARGMTNGRCKTALGKPTQFEIGIYPRNLAGSQWDFSVGELENSNQWDLVQTLTHEFGHTLKLDHPGNGEFAVMDVNHQGSLRQRDLYQWDLKCASEIAGNRSLKGYRRIVQDNQLLSEEVFTGRWSVAKVSAGITDYNNTWHWSYALKRSDCMAWTDLATTQCLYSVDNRVGIGPTDAIWREDESVQRVLYASYEESAPYQSTGKHWGKYVLSSDGFANQYSGYLKYCTGMNGWMTCSSVSDLYTGKALAVAWDNYNNRTVVAWANQTRLDDDADRRIFVSVGYIADYLLPTPDSFARTSIPPAVACNAYSAGGYYDCLLAYADQADTLNYIKIRRFWSWAGSDRYHVIADPQDYNTGVRTASPVALWYNPYNSLWYLVFRNLNAPQDLVLMSSYEGVTWYIQGWPPIGYSAVGPSAVSYWQGPGNQLVYAR